MSKNTNCLEGVVCPACGNEDRFFVVATVLVEVQDNGIDLPAERDADIEYYDDSNAICGSCDHSGKWIDFQPKWIKEG